MIENIIRELGLNRFGYGVQNKLAIRFKSYQGI